jgi:hypothetical protein
MRRKLTISLVLIISLFVLNIIGINLIEKAFLNNNTILQAAIHKGWLDSVDPWGPCVYCSMLAYGGCPKSTLPDKPICAI